MNWDHEGPGFIAAFDKNTGNELWRTSRDEQTSWSTPIVIENDGKPQVITAATGRIRAYDLADGKLLWECAGLTTNAIPSPVAGNGLIYATTGFRGSVMLAIRPGGNGDVTGTDAVAWTLKKGTPYVPSPLLYDDRLYFFASNNAILSCIDAKTGKPLYDAKRVEDMQGRVRFARRRRRPRLPRRPQRYDGRDQARRQIRSARQQQARRTLRLVAGHRRQRTLPPRPRLSLLPRRKTGRKTRRRQIIAGTTAKSDRIYDAAGDDRSPSPLAERAGLP